MSSRPIILSLTKMHEAGMSLLREAGEVRMASGTDPATLQREVVGADALIIRTGGVVDAAFSRRPMRTNIRSSGRRLDYRNRRNAGAPRTETLAHRFSVDRRRVFSRRNIRLAIFRHHRRASGPRCSRHLALGR